jgi:hypothetical protein
MRRLALLLPVLTVACATPFGEEPQPRDPREAACRAEATRVVQFRERGQTMRTDETESGRGTITVAPYSRAERDRGLAQMDREALVRDCLRGATLR